ncbi:MAG: [protein-PII] uridylyltransferase [Gammaproteobacteria bacterium]|nr:MAG: [protein-PII] uridylyltransferase [Gammaproteobacteria bacterium]
MPTSIQGAQNEEIFLFDNDCFTEELQSSTSPLAVYKNTLQEGTRVLNDAFDSGRDVVELVHKRAEFIDQLLIHAWQSMISCEDLALVAVGGYGRGELHPASDIDLMILEKSRSNKTTNQQIQQFLTFLWDIGLEVGQSVRTVKDCIAEGRADITVATNIMEARLLVGDTVLFDSMRKMTGPNKIWPTRKFFKAKLQEQVERHKKYANTEHSLEPNIKESPGGLRDIQMIGWVAKRHFAVKSLHDLVKHDFLTEEEYLRLKAGQTFLWRIRYALHNLTGRHDDRLLFDRQRHIAEIFGFHAEDNSGVEQFMKFYYRMVRELNRLNEMLLQHFQEEIIYATRREKIKPINKRFQIRNDFIEVCHDQVFKWYPFALLEIFLLIQQTPKIKGIRASTIRLIREYYYLIDDEFRNDIRNKSLFMEIIRQPRYVGHELRRMHRYGILSRYLPAFGQIEGQMQFDLFHVYSVDEHILFVIQNMRHFGLPEYANTYPLCQKILKTLPKQELLYLAGLFHDIAKGRKGDHAKLGVKDAVDFCKLHGLSSYDAELVGWMVGNHLILSKTAQREDINDPDVINKFAVQMGDREHLNYLYLLTVADVNGTNPELWNAWKDSLFSQLYNETTRALRRGLENPFNKEDRIKKTKHAALALVNKRTKSKFDVGQHWASLGEDYFIRYSPDEIAWHTNAIAENSKQQYPLIKVRQQATRGGTEIFVYMENQDNIFATTTRVLDQLGLTIVDARVISSTHGYTLDTYIVLDKSGEALKEKKFREDIVIKLDDALANLEQHFKIVSRPRSRKQKVFPIQTRVLFSQDEVNQRTIMEVVASDRPGFLSQVGVALAGCNVRLHGAKIATYGSRVEDIFFITDKQDQPITDPDKFESLTNFIIETLS